jgi:Phage integrase family
MVYKEFARHRPSDYCENESRFYLQPLKKISDDEWFGRQPMGKNSIGKITKEMALEANLASSKKSNHSGRKTTVQTLLHAGVPPTHVMQLAGHKNVQSLNSYSHLSNEQQQGISNILSTTMSTSTKIPIQSNTTETATVPPEIPTYFTQNSTTRSHEFDFDDGCIRELINEPLCDPDEMMTDKQHMNANSQNAVYKNWANGNKVTPSDGLYNFLNGTTINGNITINITSQNPKRIRLDKDNLVIDDCSEE